MASQVTKGATLIGFGLLFCLALGYFVTAIFGIWFALISPEMPIWGKALVLIGFTAMGLLLFAVVRERIVASKTDKYKDVQI